MRCITKVMSKNSSLLTLGIQGETYASLPEAILGRVSTVGSSVRGRGGSGRVRAGGELG